MTRSPTDTIKFLTLEVLQRVLARPHWPADWTPETCTRRHRWSGSMWTPYGRFDLDMDTRIAALI